MPAEPQIAFDDRGLVPCVAQDSRTGEVLTLAWMNAEALERTIESGELHFWSRSREEIWHKGETSGNTMRLSQLRLDCDGDAIVALVEPAGPACHTGTRSCFSTDLQTGAEPAPAPHEALTALDRVIAERKAERPQGSYTVELLDDPALIGAKVREETEEVVRAAESETDRRVAEESADVLYHLAVLTRSRDVPLSAALGVLDERRR